MLLDKPVINHSGVIWTMKCNDAFQLAGKHSERFLTGSALWAHWNAALDQWTFHSVVRHYVEHIGPSVNNDLSDNDTQKLNLIRLLFPTITFDCSKRVFILGPSHNARLSGCALSTVTKYETPFYDLPLDMKGG